MVIEAGNQPLGKGYCVTAPNAVMLQRQMAVLPVHVAENQAEPSGPTANVPVT
jgi:hypothetical protein